VAQSTASVEEACLPVEQYVETMARVQPWWGGVSRAGWVSGRGESSQLRKHGGREKGWTTFERRSTASAGVSSRVPLQARSCGGVWVDSYGDFSYQELVQFRRLVGYEGRGGGAGFSRSGELESLSPTVVMIVWAGGRDLVQ